MHELIIVGVVAVLLFGRKLPEVARSMGQSYREFKRGLSEFHTSMDMNEPYRPAKKAPPKRYHDDIDDHDEIAAPKFEPPPSEPKVEDTAAR